MFRHLSVAIIILKAVLLESLRLHGHRVSEAGRLVATHMSEDAPVPLQKARVMAGEQSRRYMLVNFFKFVASRIWHGAHFPRHDGVFFF